MHFFLIHTMIDAPVECIEDVGLKHMGLMVTFHCASDYISTLSAYLFLGLLFEVLQVSMYITCRWNVTFNQYGSLSSQKQYGGKFDIL